MSGLMEVGPEKIVRHLAKILEVHVADSKLQAMKDYPGYPALSSLADFLEESGIATMAVRVAPEQVSDIPTPAIMQLNTPGYEFVVLRLMNDRVVEYYDPDNGVLSCNILEFKERLGGVALLLDAGGEGTKREYKTNHNARTVSRVMAALMGIMLVLPVIKFSPLAGTVYLLNLVGVVISVFLVQKQFGIVNPYIDSMCQRTDGDSCSDVINSPRSMLFNLFFLSEAAAAYFIGGVMASIVTVNDTLTVAGAQLLSGGIAAAFSIGLFYYQWRVLKKWCRLCLMVSGILWIEIPLLIYNATPLTISAWSVFVVALGYILPLFLWISIRDRYRLSLAVPKLEQRLLKFTRSQYVFQNLLERQPSIAVGELSHEIVMGPKEAPLQITFVSSPTCGSCKLAHHIMERLIHRHEGQVHVKIRFMTSASGNASVSDRVVRHVVKLMFAGQMSAAIEAITSWYGDEVPDVNEWIECHPVEVEVPETAISAVMTEHSNWCAVAGVTATPSVFIGDKPMPDGFAISDLFVHARYLIGEMRT